MLLLFRLGITTCFDVRFPDMFTRLAKAGMEDCLNQLKTKHVVLAQLNPSVLFNNSLQQFQRIAVPNNCILQRYLCGAFEMCDLYFMMCAVVR